MQGCAPLANDTTAAINHPQSVAPPHRARLDGVQYLRGLAAVTVAMSHLVGDIAYHGGPELIPRYYAGAAGVDLFFVISGFVMIHTATDRFGAPGAAAAFLRRRIVRVAPLYWLATFTYCLIQMGQGKWDVVRPDLVANSLVFWPYSDADGLRLPVYSIGWTLNFEMMFYAVFALGMPFRRSGLVLVVGGLIGLVVLGTIVDLPQPLRFWSAPILLEFVMGIGLGLAYRRGLRLTRVQAVAAVLIAAAMIVGGTLAGFNAVPNVPEHFPRWIAWGAPCALVFAGTVLRAGPPLAPRPWVLRLGASSYAIYLVHPLVLIAMRPLLPRCAALMGEPLGSLLYLLLAVVMVGSIAMALHAGFEKPLMRRLSPGLPRRRRPLLAPGPAVSG